MLLKQFKFTSYFCFIDFNIFLQEKTPQENCDAPLKKSYVSTGLISAKYLWNIIIIDFIFGY